jgi:putative salt-induced outer membrane protein YdiY
MFRSLSSIPFFFALSFYSLAVNAVGYANSSYNTIKSTNKTATTADILSSLESTQEEPMKKPPVFSASAQLGFLYLTGNTRSADMKAGFDFSFEKDLWRSLLTFDSLIKKTEKEDGEGNDSFETTDNKWSVVTQTNYTVNTAKRNYLYGNLSYEENRFSSFDSQASLSTGWGRRWFETNKASLDADIGPGFKRDVTRISQEDRDNGMQNETRDTLILQAQALYIRKINEHIEFKQLLIAKHAIEKGENSLYKTETSLTSKLIDSLQIKLSFIIDYNSKVDSDKDNTDTQTSAVLVYSF